MTQKIKDRMKVVDTTLDNYEQKLGLSGVATPPGTEEELNGYLNMNRDELQALSQEDCSQISYRLAQFALYIQRTSNREQSRITWAKAVTGDIVAPLLDGYGQYTKYEVKLELIAKDNEAVAKLKSIIRHAQERLNRLEYVSTGIRYMSEVMTDLRRTKYAQVRASDV